MKVHINIDCTAMEARVFFGLPDVKPLQDHLLQDIEEHLRTNLKAMDIERLLRTWLPGSFQELEKIQSALWSQFLTGERPSATEENPADQSKQ
ncbi:hypothetical protein RIEGSTA812A_PEG_1100 [invertebrate metagenome]|uniref:Uncharacterized protein n=1 Tax=invertebrate metagenome TaxID=1711999 RepID=A0A484H681_9ZZZZ